LSAKRVAGKPEGGEERRPAAAPVDAPAPDETETQREEREASELVERDLDELGEARKERDEYLDLAQRTRADFENYRKRVAAEEAVARSRGKAELARELIPAIDNLERALRAAGVNPDAGGGGGGGAGGELRSEEVSARDALAHGVALVYRELRASLERAGVESYDPAGQAFDPELHEALTTRAEEGADPGVVLETADRGYRLDGQVLRPARVVVSE
jgi:molecular chaperone GrpE